MSTGWTAPGATEGSSQPDPTAPQGSVDTHPAPSQGAPSGAPAPQGPRRELVQDIPLFPLRPLSVGEVFGAALRIYRLRARTVLGLAAIVYGVAFVLVTATTGAGMIPVFGDVQALMEDPEASGSSDYGTSQMLLTVVSSLITGIFTMVASSLVTVALTHVAIGEATGRGASTSQMWATVRRLALPAIGVSLLLGVLGTVAFALPAALGTLPLLLLQEPTVLTIGALVVGVLIGILVALWIWARMLLAIPALVVERTGVFGSIARSFRMTAGRKLWRVLGVGVLLYVCYTLGTQVISGVFSVVAMIVYVAILLASSMQGLVLGLVLMTIIMMIGSYLATVLLAPFLSAGFAAVYADNRMRHEAWDIDLMRSSRENWSTDSTR
ncbi:glycerophosphodiester phosphodiesterase [Brachybacterium sp. JB7]|uniref:glycerophosphoryl diester phosphodiesterase membrane domain-containing protein n=1 Tax=Brachybacterium sp. JB7 TaxID=2024478 RepID=UPI000DF212AA|nr:glycerophosphoryl diester phosphodiesterase membrane domain-containing protein [Brachybacterium sp. JB7]RCS64393.1 glycerophosphodiester phosphodiesterase [Brachybacterium sp. JB7]